VDGHLVSERPPSDAMVANAFRRNVGQVRRVVELRVFMDHLKTRVEVLMCSVYVGRWRHIHLWCPAIRVQSCRVGVVIYLYIH